MASSSKSNGRHVYNYTVLCYNPRNRQRTFGTFFSSRKAAERRLESDKRANPRMRYSVAAVRVD